MQRFVAFAYREHFAGWPATLLRWRRKGFQLFWRLKSKTGRGLVKLERREATLGRDWREVSLTRQTMG